jgi:hypothetical protein
METPNKKQYQKRSILVTYTNNAKKPIEEKFRAIRSCSIRYNLSESTIRSFCENKRKKPLGEYKLLPKDLNFSYIPYMGDEEKKPNLQDAWFCDLCQHSVKLCSKKAHLLTNHHLENVVRKNEEEKENQIDQVGNDTGSESD